MIDFTNAIEEFNNYKGSEKKIETEITDIVEVLEESKKPIDVSVVKEKFWETFIIDRYR